MLKKTREDHGYTLTGMVQFYLAEKRKQVDPLSLTQILSCHGTDQL